MQPTYVPLPVLDANRRTEAHLLNGTAKRGPHRCTVLDRTWYKASWTFLLRPPGGRRWAVRSQCCLWCEAGSELGAGSGAARSELGSLG